MRALGFDVVDAVTFADHEDFDQSRVLRILPDGVATVATTAKDYLPHPGFFARLGVSVAVFDIRVDLPADLVGAIIRAAAPA